MLRLPIDSYLPAILSALERHSSLVLQASPGSGKTTRVPPALLKASFLPKNSEILVLEPRRLAARFAAERVAHECGEKIGGLIGYRFRFENRTSAQTRLTFLTEGMLMRRLIHDPDLNGVSLVILDEFHERHLHTDVAISYLRFLQKTKRPELKLLVMSATLNREPIRAFLGDAPEVIIDSPLHPIEFEYLAGAAYLDKRVVDGVTRALSHSGDMLVFLPGMADIRRAATALESLGRSRQLMVLPLHGELSKEEQELALTPQRQRRVILSTNIAESSLTIDGISIVIDSGLERRANYSAWTGIPRLETKATSKASAIQRAGRAGRLGPGLCIRLYSKAEFDGRASFSTPELHRADLTQTVMELKALGIPNSLEFDWFEKPPEAALKAAEALLFRTGIVSQEGKLTPIGKKVAELPAHPRIGRVLVEAQSRGVSEPASRLGALLIEGGADGLDVLEAIRRTNSPMLARTAKQLLNSLDRSSIPAAPNWEDALARACLTGFPDRIAQIRKLKSQRARDGKLELLLSDGGAAEVADTAFTRGSPYFIALDIGETQGLGGKSGRVFANLLCSIEEEWLLETEPPCLEENAILSWDKDRGRLQQKTRLSCGALVIEESSSRPQASPEAARIFLENTLILSLNAPPSWHQWVESLGRLWGTEEVENLLGRLQVVSGTLNEDRSRELLNALLGYPWMDFSTIEIKAINGPEFLATALGKIPLGSLESKCPSSVALPSGRRLKINYPLDKAPWGESRLQDFFGLKTGPVVGPARTPVTLHLLAPNRRAVQVTQDLAGFWERSYPTIRKELSRRYPRHQWPEKP